MKRKSETTILLNRHRNSGALDSLYHLLMKMGVVGEAAAADLKGQRYLDLVNLEFDGVNLDPEEFRDAYLASEMLSKYPFEIEGLDRGAEALSMFASFEAQCADTNARLAGYDEKPVRPFLKEIRIARQLIANCVGSVSDNWDDIERLCTFTSGASWSLKRRYGDPSNKFGLNKPAVTSNCLSLAEFVVKRVPLWSGQLSDFTLTVGNKVTTVPKNAKTDRTIAIEPELNMYLQRGIGRFIRRRLAKVGNSLKYQTRNQDLAFVGSWSGELATLDLKGASDTLSLGVCELLLPSDWNQLVLMARSPFGVLPDRTLVTYEKVSSMGNGYTFELESLIFWAIVRACVISLELEDRRMSVYGDDIICPVAAVDLVRGLLTYLGFTLNEKKSHWSGPFRESCGKHFYLGHDVTPFYVRKPVDSIPRIVSLCNRIKAHASLRYGGNALDGRFKNTWEELADKIPSRLRSKISGPSNLGDMVLHSEWDEVAPPRKRGNGHVGWTVWGLRASYHQTRGEDVGYLLSRLSAAEQRNLVSPLEVSWEVMPYKFAIVPSYEDMVVLMMQGLLQELEDIGQRDERQFIGLDDKSSRLTYSLCKTVATEWSGYGCWVD